MRPSIEKIRKWFFYLMISSVAMYLIVTLVFSLDPTKDKLEKFLASSSEVRTQIGNIQTLSLNKRTSVEASEQQAPYRLYSFYAKGQKADARIVVRVEQVVNNRDEEHFTIISLERE